ncbi:MAG: patatin-like phospholipase family protein [Planctomycetota bacterium]
MSLGLALGGGGAKGLAHIPILEAFDEAGVRPDVVSGTSIGAILGALYAAGKSAAEIRALVGDMLPADQDGFSDTLRKFTGNSLLSFFSFNFGDGGLLDTKDLETFFERAFGVTTFEELTIPLRVVAADFWKREEVVYDSGHLASAVRASMALPGIFTAVERDDRILVDGGGVNPLPFNLLKRECEAVVAVDVSGQKVPDESSQPGTFEALFGMSQIMSNSIVQEQLRTERPDLYLRPTIENVRVLEFWRADEIIAGAEPEKQECLDWLNGRRDAAR